MNTQLDTFSEWLNAAIGSSARPVVIYSGLWPVARAWGGSMRALVPALLDRILLAVGDQRTLLMPTFTKGYHDGVIDLDSEPCTTGVLAEQLRVQPEVGRTRSAFFSFAVHGPERDALCELRPKDAWGDGSVCSWLEERDAICITIGVPMQTASVIHLVEWRCRDVIEYRISKAFAGQVRCGNKTETLEENLFVRVLEPPVKNDFSRVIEPLARVGIEPDFISGAAFASMQVGLLVNTLVPLVRSDPNFLLAQSVS